jgi:hypothetical protein
VRFTEINLFGVYVAPMSSMMVLVRVGVPIGADRDPAKRAFLRVAQERGGQLRVRGGKTQSERMFTELPQVTDIARSALFSANVLRIRGSGSEQFHARLSPTNATRLSGMEWLWSANRA